MPNQKILLMGRSGSGKTSMRSIIFANYMAKDTARLTKTNDVEHTNVRFLGNLVLNLWDCGGQYTFFGNYLESEAIFRNVEVLIYVFDIDSVDHAKDMSQFSAVLSAMERLSPDASIFILIHKMDLVPEDDREKEFVERSRLVQYESEHFKMKCFATSIWDETLYKAWSQIVYSLIPNVGVLETQLRDFSVICAADEVVLFERATFLVISHTSILDSNQYDCHRFERISNIIKQFKISCSKSQSQFRGMEVRNSQFTAYIDLFTSNTYIMVIMTGSGSKIPTTLTQLNIAAAKKYFESFLPETA
eukprot:gene5937-8185_t